MLVTSDRHLTAQHTGRCNKRYTPAAAVCPPAACRLIVKCCQRAQFRSQASTSPSAQVSRVTCSAAAQPCHQQSPEGMEEEQELQVPQAEGEVDPNALIIFVLGGPGSGKGTQCAKIAEKYGCQHLSAGDLLRDEVERGSELGKRCDSLMKEGALVPTEVTVGVLRNALVTSKAKCFLVDGFPRELDQAHAFEESIKPCRLVLAFDCPFDVLEQRLEERSKTSDRVDDNAETMRKRFDTFQQQSKPVIEHYTAEGRCHNISAVEGPDEIFEKVCAVLDPILCA